METIAPNFSRIIYATDKHRIRMVRSDGFFLDGSHLVEASRQAPCFREPEVVLRA